MLRGTVALDSLKAVFAKNSEGIPESTAATTAFGCQPFFSFAVFYAGHFNSWGAVSPEKLEHGVGLARCPCGCLSLTHTCTEHLWSPGWASGSGWGSASGEIMQEWNRGGRCRALSQAEPEEGRVCVGGDWRQWEMPSVVVGTAWSAWGSGNPLLWLGQEPGCLRSCIA